MFTASKLLCKVTILTVLSASTLLSSAALAENTSAKAQENRGDNRERIEPKGFLYGIGIGLNQEPYKGFDYRFIPLPILGYRSENFSVLGPFVTYDALSFGDIEITLQAAPRFQGFDESDSDIFANMDERKFSMDAGIGVKYERNDWKINFTGMADILGRSDGYQLKTNIGRVFRKGPIFFEPNLSVSYLDDNHVDYYYGVKAHEVNPNTYQYSGESTVNTTLGFSVATPIFLEGFTRIAIDHTWYGSGITDSPLVDEKRSWGARLLFSKFF